MDTVKLDELTFYEIKCLIDAGNRTLIFPVGTLEAHGYHAPVGTDNFCAEDIAWELGKRLGFPVAPTLNYGITTGLIAYPGSVRVNADTYTELIRQILANFLQMGFRRIVIVNGHGGNTETLSRVAKEMIMDNRGSCHFIIIDWWQLDREALNEVYNRPGGHAALDETACVLAFRPSLIKSNQYNKESVCHFQSGVISMPYSAAMIVYEDGDASPDFNVDKARIFIEKVIDKIEKVIKNEVTQFDNSFTRI